MNLMGLWDGKNFSISKEFSRTTKIRRRLDFYGSEIYGAVSIVSIHSGYTVMDMLQKRIDTTTAGSAFQYSILQTIVDRINATLVLRRISTWSQFSRLPNESLSGTIGLLNSSLADVSVTPLSITADRLPYATPTATTWRAQFGFVFRHPKSTSLRAIYLQPFTNILWIATLIILVLYWMVFIVALRYYNDPEGAPGSAFLGIFGAFLQQGYSEKLLPFSGRILLVFGFIFSLVCYQFYSTFIVGSLIVDSPKNIRTIHDLAASKLLIGANPVPYNDYLFNSTSKILSSLYADRIKKPGNFFPPDIGIQMIQKVDLHTISMWRRCMRLLFKTFLKMKYVIYKKSYLGKL
uniref:Ionotropic glutamate receptor C-terminal domain-containing protein n=1 Tax=Lutzomyia longipalpis TaxID=7200 RepID=A0A3F2ZDE5_LUTLO